MRTATSNFNTVNDAIQKVDPVFAVSFEIITGLGTFGFRTVYVTDTFADIASPPSGTTFKKYLKNVNVSFPNIEPFTPNFTPGQTVFELIDVDGEVTALLASFDAVDLGIFGQTVTVKQGYAALNYADFMDWTSGQVRNIEMASDQTTWRITVENDSFRLNNPIFANLAESKLAAAITSSDTSFTLAIADGFINPATFFSNADNKVMACVKIDDEIITYSAVNYGTEVFTVSARGEGGTVAAAHEQNAVVKQGLLFFCDPMRTLLHILTTSNATSAGNKSSDYDLGAPAADATPTINVFDIGLGISSTLINETNIERIGWKIFSAIEFTGISSLVVFEKVDNALQFINERLLAPYNLFLKAGFANFSQAGSHSEDAGGKIDVGMLDWVDWKENWSNSFSFTDNNSKSLSWSSHADDLRTTVQIDYGHNYASDSYQKSLVYQVDDAILYGAYKKHVIKHPGLVLGADADQIQLINTYRFMQNFDAPVSIDFDSQFLASRVQPGDRVQISRSSLPDIGQGTLGWTAKKCLIIENMIDAAPMRLTFKALTWDVATFVQDALSGLYTINKVAEGSINDKTLAVDASATATTQAADAYYSNTVSAYQADRIIFFIRVTPPNFAGGSDFETLNIKVSALSNVPAIINSETREYIRFNPKDSVAFTIEIDLYSQNIAGDTPDRVKVDWISTTATGSEIPTVEFIGVWFVKSNTRYST